MPRCAKEVVEGYNGTGIPMLMTNEGLCSGIVWPEVLPGYQPLVKLEVGSRRSGFSGGSAVLNRPC